MAIDGSLGCGLYYLKEHDSDTYRPYSPLSYQRTIRNYLPLAAISAHTTILSSVSRTELTQTFTNPSTTDSIPELRYTFPLYDGVSVVGFTCTINNDRVIRGLVKEKQAARKTFDEAVAKGQTAGLLEQLPDANDVFTTTIGNVPADAEIRVDIIVLGELKHDAEVDGIRFTLPTHIAPRYGTVQGATNLAGPQTSGSGISITVDVEMQPGSAITSLQSPSHPIGVTIGSVSAAQTQPQTPQFNLASATLSLDTTTLDKDFVLLVKATSMSSPVAILETHPTIPNQRALMTTLVPKFNLPSERPEIVFVCDQSGSMEGSRMTNLRSALQLFLKSLPVGVRFNICSFGTTHSFLFPEGSRKYDADSLSIAITAVASFQANYGGTEMRNPIESTIDRRVQGLDLEVFVLTDGQIQNQSALFDMVNTRQEQAQGSIRIFTLGIGHGASTALIEGLARAGNGFAQTVGDHEKLDKKVVRMLKAALTAHITDYTLEVKYRKPETSGCDVDDFELIDRVSDLTVEVGPTEKESQDHKAEQKPISLFDESVDLEANTDSPSTLPAVAVPRILQAPFRIPALFPFHRTNVYLLLSPDTAPAIPESVVLRASSKHGPLVLEIPVTTPASSSASSAATIHQLAARKAILELEEGRGWIFHAKQQHEDDKSVREAHPAHFSDMVEREAVRLGVQFQVGGKWCSFVAVEDNMGSEEPERSETAQVDLGSTTMGSSTPRRTPAPYCRGGGGFSRSSHFSSNPSLGGGLKSPLRRTRAQKQFREDPVSHPEPLFDPPQSASRGRKKTSAISHPLFDSPSRAFGQSAPPPLGLPAGFGNFNMSCDATGFGASRPSGLFEAQSQELAAKKKKVSASSSSLFGSPSQAFGQSAYPQEESSTRSSGTSLFGVPSQPAATPTGFRQRSLFDHTADQNEGRFSGGGGLMGCAVISDSMDASEVDLRVMDPSYSIDRALFAPYSPQIIHEGRERAPAPVETPLETIVRLQSFDGSWTWSDTLKKAMGIDEAQQLAQLSSNDWATITVIAFLRKKLAAEEESWELVVNKALVWLEGQGKAGSLEEVEDKIAKTTSSVFQ